MQKSPLLPYLLFLFFWSPGKSQAQTQEVKFNLVTSKSGVALGKVNSITQDHYGFMWFSDQTNRCITRYDGTSMKRFQNDPKNPKTLGGYYPECLTTDSEGNIWIGFYGQGLDKFDPHTNTFTHYRHDPNDPGSLAHDFVAAVLVDHLGNIWAGTYGGLELFDRASGKFKHFSHDKNDSTTLSCNTIRSLYEDREGTIWVGTGFAFDDVDEGGLNRFDRNTGAFKRYMNDPKNPQSLIDDKVRAIFEDSKGNFWVGTKGVGLHSMDRKTGVFTRHTYDPKNPNKLSGAPINDNFDHITFITEDAENKLWIGTAFNGINRYNPETKTVTHFGNNADQTGAFSDNSGWWAYHSRDDNMWISTQEANLYRVDIYNNLIPFLTDKGHVFAFYEESESVLWYGTRDGLIREDIKNGTIKKFLHEPGNANSLSNSFINRIYRDKNGKFWLGTASGLNRYDPETGVFTRYQNDPNDSTSVSHNDISEIYEDKDSNLWIATFGGGLNRLDRTTGRFTRFQHKPGDDSTLGANIILSIIEDDKRNLWIGLDNNAGISRFSQRTGTFTSFLRGLSVTSFYTDAEGLLWAGTQNGLYKYDAGVKDFVDHNINATVISIIEDNNKNLWIGSASGIIRLNQKREHLIIYGKENGVGEGFEVSKSYKQKDGKLIFGYLNGYYAIYPEKLKASSDTSKVYFTDFQLNGKSVIPGPDSPLKESLFKVNEIRLNHDQNVFSIQFTELDFRQTEESRMYYQLETFDSDWRQTKADDPVSYFRVPPGKYIFRIKSENSSSGLWSEASIEIVIKPPWWQTWLAYGCYGIIFIGGVFLVDRVQRKRILARANAEARAKELKQAREIEKAYKELKATQSQLIQSEKMASLGELTAGIAHEIQNPLNFVNNFSEVNSELIDELNDEAGKGNLEQVKTIAKNIKENEEKISHHGKRADAIVKGMLQHSSSGSGKKEPTDINALADEYFRLAYHGLRAKDKSFNATMKTDYDETIGSISVIPQDISRVILNLITNAFYAVNARLNESSGQEKAKQNSSGYEPTVSVSTKKEGNNVLISVKDNGNGIPKKIMDKIFQPFFTTKPTGQGTGLGLSLSYDIVKAHGGEIKVETKEASPPARDGSDGDDPVGREEGLPAGQAGSTFTIQIPIL